MTFDDVAAHLFAIKYSVEHGMTPKQPIEKMSSTQQYSSLNRQVGYKWHQKTSTEWEESGAKKVNRRKGFSRPCPTLSGATGDFRKILIIRPLFYRISCNFNSMFGNKLRTGFIQIKLILGLNSYDKMQLYARFELTST